jgi:hypothetical protein
LRVGRSVTSSVTGTAVVSVGTFGAAELPRSRRLLQQVGGLAHLAHRLVDRRLELLLEPGAHFLQLGVCPTELADRIRELLGPNTTRANRRITTISVPDMLNTRRSLRGWQDGTRAAASPVTPRSPHHVRPSGCARTRTGEHDRRL